MNILCLEAHVPLGFPAATVWQARPALAYITGQLPMYSARPALC